MARRVTLQDVAAKCGVSPSTVSLVYNNHPLSQRLAGETVEKVQRAILELGYHPTAAAKNLATGITGKIALSIPLSDTLSQKEPWLLEVMGGILSVLEEHRYDFQLSIFHDQDPEPAYSRLASSQGVDGLILYSPRLADQQIKKMEETTLPFVFCGRNPNLPEASFVDVDNVKLGYEGTAKLIEAGHSRIAFVHLSLAYQSYLERYQGYQKALGEYGLKEELLLLKGLEPQAAMIKSIKGGSTAFFLAHAGFAPLVYEAAKLTRRQIPAELSLIAADDLPLAPYLVPALSSFQIPHRELGKRAAEILMAKILGKEEERQVILPHTYIRRGSI